MTDHEQRERADAPLYPLFVKLAGREVLVVGGGAVATDKARELVAHGACVSVVSPEVRPELAAIAQRIVRAPFSPAHVDDAFLVVAAAPAPVNREVLAACEVRRRFVVAVDDVASASAFGAARLHRGGLTFAISSSGSAPALVALLRRALEALLPDDLDEWHALAVTAREVWKREKVPFRERRRRLLDALSALERSDARIDGARERPTAVALSKGPAFAPETDEGERAS